MIQNDLKKYFSRRLNDLENRKFRVWQRIEAHLLHSSANSAAENFSAHKLNLGFKSLGVAFVLVLLGGIFISALTDGLPDLRLAKLKNAIQKNQPVAVNAPAAEPAAEIAIIEEKTKQLAVIENKAAKGKSLTRQEKIAAENIKREVGQAVIKMMDKQAVAAATSEPAAPASKSSAPAAVATAPPKTNLVQTAEAKIGEAVAQFLRSSPTLSDTEKTEKILAIAKRVQEEESAEKSSAEGEGDVAEAKAAPAAAQKLSETLPAEPTSEKK